MSGAGRIKSLLCYQNMSFCRLSENGLGVVEVEVSPLLSYCGEVCVSVAR